MRQPLAAVLVKLPDAAARPAVEKLAAQIQDELNVKAVTFADSLGDLVAYAVKGRPQLLGPKYQRDAPRVLAALRDADAAKLASEVQAGNAVEVDGFVVQPDEVDVVVSDRPGLSVATANGLAAAVTTTLTPELVEEGLARELVHRIQTMRRAADFNIEDRITTYFEASEAMRSVIENFGGYIKQETLSRELRPGDGPDDAYRERMSLDGEALSLAVSR